ncbi:MAG: tRNA (adenosine(37)-N6)-dimethylallyltransferase MiaA [Sphingobacteriales bacterium]|nr:tRNA (adenosine(37)-N6)-dimethylallyltransferase MiaA [Sphingobacteriales bacterium]MBI3719586.1 tRNA (adenosine(37)-N6)-dimethylallyltransferase MiaA [Sphingobacteriales bacterium]
MHKKTCIVIVGPTAAGKTSLAIELAKKYKTQIISADSRQCFKEISIGVAKPSVEQLSAVKHYFINSHSIQDEVNARVFESYALNAVNEIFQQNDVAIMVGGTGLYINAFCNGIDEIPDIDPIIRTTIIQSYNEKGLGWLQQQVKKKDELYYSTCEILNPQRLMRALEVKLSTGKSIREYQTQKKVERDFNIIKIGLQLPKEELHRNINYRVEEMVKEGLLAEVESMLSYKHLNALQTVGYREFFEYFDGNISLDEAIELVKKNTRHYAKRQVTWFKKDTSDNCFSPSDIVSLVFYLDASIQCTV